MEEVREPMGMLKWDHIRTMLEMPDQGGMEREIRERSGRCGC